MKIPARQYFLLLARYLRPQARLVWLLAACLTASIALTLIGPQVVRVFIDMAQAGAARDALYSAALAFIGMAILQQALSVAAAYLGEAVGWTATNRLRDDLAAHCLRLDMGFHKARTPGEMIERIDGDVALLSNFFSNFVIQMLGNVALLGGVLVLLTITDWRVGLSLTAFTVLAILALGQVRAVAAPTWVRVREEGARVYGFLGEALAGTEDVRANGAEPYVFRRFSTLLRGWRPLQWRSGDAGAAMWASTLIAFAVADAIAFALSAWLYGSGQITLGTAYAIFFYANLLARPIEQIRTQMQDLQQADAGIQRVRELLDTPSRLVSGHAALPSGALAVEFRGVTFAYEDGEAPVLDGIDLRLEPGRVLGLLGHTGSGKTTLARLLFRMHDPRSGEVRVGGVALPEADLGALRARVGMVTQDVQLFNASVRDNLTFFDRAIPEERLWAALDELGLAGWVRGLPEGLDTVLSPGGLSAGEAQLLAMARLFLRDPGLVVLDEASSRLDPATERLIEGAVARLLRGRTGIIIAHRLGTVARTDEILILEGGRVEEHGDRARLARDSRSRFARLLRGGLQEVLA